MHAIECRINAENVLRDFAPNPGKINAFHTPKGFGVRVDTLAYAGYTVQPYYDSMIAKLICRSHSSSLIVPLIIVKSGNRWAPKPCAGPFFYFHFELLQGDSHGQPTWVILLM